MILGQHLVFWLNWHSLTSWLMRITYVGHNSDVHILFSFSCLSGSFVSTQWSSDPNKTRKVVAVQLERVAEAFAPDHLIRLEAAGWCVSPSLSPRLFETLHPPLPDWKHHGIIWMSRDLVASLMINLFCNTLFLCCPFSLLVVCVSSELTTQRQGGEWVPAACALLPLQGTYII